MNNDIISNKTNNGTSAKEIWQMYQILPSNTCFTLELHKSNAEIITLSFMKWQNKKKANIQDSLSADEQRLVYILNEYCTSGFSKFEFIWMHGFGNSVTFRVYV